MRHPALILLAISLVIFTACGIEFLPPTMTEDEAIDTLLAVPMTTGSGSRGITAQSDVSVENLGFLVQDLVDSGRVQVRGAARGAVSSSGKVDLSTLNQVIGLLQGQNGQRPSLLNIASGLAALNGGSGSTAGSKLQGILELLNQLAPIIATVAPQFSGIITAITTIAPMIIAIVQMFKKPKASNTFVFAPAKA